MQIIHLINIQQLNYHIKIHVWLQSQVKTDVWQKLKWNLFEREHWVRNLATIYAKILRSLCKKGHCLEKSISPPVVAVVTNSSYEGGPMSGAAKKS